MSTVELAEKARQYRETQAFIRQLQDEAESIKAALTAEMDRRGLETLEADMFTVHWKETTSARVDTTALKREMPDVAAQFTKTTQIRRFSVA
jgi:predicted phage-related endonuclease